MYFIKLITTLLIEVVGNGGFFTNDKINVKNVKINKFNVKNEKVLTYVIY